MKKIGKRSIWISIVVATMLLTGCGNQTGSADQATGSDAADFSGLTTEVDEVITEEATTEATLEVVANEDSRPEAVPATTEIGGGKKKAEETTEEKKPSTTESAKPSTNHSSNGNSGSANSGQSTTPKPSNSGSNSGNSGGNLGNSGSGNSGNSNSTPSPKPSTPATTEAPTAQHQHNFNVWVKTKDAWDETVVDTPEQTIEHPAEYKTVPAVKCHGCNSIFTTADAYLAHPCGDAYGYTTTTAQQMTHDAWTETIPAKTHTVHHDEEGYWACSCGARK